MTAPGKVVDIAGLLTRELATLESFIALLQKEGTLLASRADEGLTALAQEKTAAAVELARLATLRDQELARLHLPPGRAGMDAWTLTDAGSASQRNWDRLLALAAQGRAMNEANGTAIALQLQHNQQALAVLMAAADRTATYGPDGQARPGPGSRSLGSA
ncbi:MAG: flagellar protein FlgN [Rhodocyclales bacterium]|nr:flagellar protein FlgN [Rhodocyclales bacterium]